MLRSEKLHGVRVIWQMRPRIARIAHFSRCFRIAKHLLEPDQSRNPFFVYGPKSHQVLEAAGATVLFLPGYSPDFNPVETAITRIKVFLKKTAARSKTELDVAIAKAIDHITPQSATV